jgi:hypothetical protein
MPDQGQLTQHPICPICHEVELTDQELVKAKGTGINQCWYCLVDTMIKSGINEMFIPDPTEFGRAGETKEHGIQLAKEKMLRPINPTDALAQMQRNLAQPVTATPGAAPTMKPVLQGSQAVNIPLSEQERKEFIMKFGIDPAPKNKPYEIVVQGTHEDLYLKFSCPVQIDLSYERELKRIMGGVVDSFGKLLKYGPAFAATLIELENLSGSMFLGGK